MKTVCLSRRLVKSLSQVNTRAAATAATSRQQVSQDVAYESAKPYNSIPKEPFWKFMYALMVDPKKKLQIDKLVKEWFEKYGPIVRLNIPGLGERVFLKEPSQVQTLHLNDGKNPIEPGFDHFVYYRNKMRKDLFPQTAGLLGHHGEEWYEVRSKVQQDMMRPKSAMFYINDIEEISQELTQVLADSMDSNNEVDDVLEYVNQWALESIVAIFLDSRLNCLQKDLPDDSEPRRFVEAVKVKDIEVINVNY